MLSWVAHEIAGIPVIEAFSSGQAFGRVDLLIDRDTKRPEIFRLAGSGFVALQQDGDGWLRAETFMVRFCAVEGRPARLRIEDAIDVRVQVEI